MKVLKVFISLKSLVYSHIYSMVQQCIVLLSSLCYGTVRLGVNVVVCVSEGIINIPQLQCKDVKMYMLLMAEGDRLHCAGAVRIKLSFAFSEMCHCYLHS